MSEVRVVATLMAKPECGSVVRDAVVRVVAPSRGEAGNIQYDLHEEPEHPGIYVFFEIWASEKALQYHMESEHFQTFVKEIEGKLEQLDIKKLRQVI